MKNSTKFQAVILLCLLSLFSGGGACFQTGTTGDTPEEKKCGSSHQISGGKKLYASDSSDQHFDLVTPNAKNDCEAFYQLQFLWADTKRADTDKTMPPLGDLEHAFSPQDELSYFPHEEPHFASYSWILNFSIGNKTTGLPSTRYAFHTWNPSKKKEDSILVTCSIRYYPQN